MRRVAVLLMLGAGTAASVQGQVVTGRVLDAETDSVVEGAMVSLAPDTVAPVLETTVTDASGGFSITVPQPGIYVLKGTRLGYAPTWSQPFFVDQRDTLQIQFRLATEAIPIEPLQVIGRRPGGQRLANWGFYDRMIEYADRGRARFYTPEDLNESRAGRVTDLLRDVPRLELVRDGRQIFIFVRGTRQRVPVFLDGHHMRLRRDESVDEMIALSDVEALEIYWRWAPAQYGGGAAIVMWTGPRKE